MFAEFKIKIKTEIHLIRTEFSRVAFEKYKNFKFKKKLIKFLII